MDGIKDFDIRIRQGGDEAIAAVRELLGFPSYSDSGVAHELREYAKKLAGRGCDDIAMAAELMRFAADYIDKMPSLRTRWIPVSERLPEEGEPVMAWNSGGWCLKPWACHVICDYEDGEWREVEERDLYPGVTHWMPLPPEPEGWEALPEPPAE